LLIAPSKPGIHNPRLWSWIPGPRLRHVPE
jgi:hypothetical protein